MRVTQGMISNDMLRHLSENNNKMDKYMDQLATGKKISRPSDDPVSAKNAIGYRKEVSETSQFKRNSNEVHTWMDNSDAALDKTTQALQKLRELATQASNDTYDADERKNMQEEVRQLKKQLIDIGNTKTHDKYIFNGTDTNTKPIEVDEDGNVDILEDQEDGGENNVMIEVSQGTKIQANVKPGDVFNDDLFERIDNFEERLETEDEDAIDDSIAELDESLGETLNARADLGARMNRLELVENRLDEQEVIAESVMAENEDVDYEKAITDLKTQETMHHAALSAGSRIIQPSLIDFLN